MNKIIVMGGNIPELFKNIKFAVIEHSINLIVEYVKEAGIIIWVTKDKYKIKYLLTKHLRKNNMGVYVSFIIDSLYGADLEFNTEKLSFKGEYNHYGK